MKKKAVACGLVGVAILIGAVGMNAWAEEKSEVEQLSSAQISAIAENCGAIRDYIRTVQHDDSRTRVYLGRYYELILSKYIMPLNVRLIENNMSDAELIDNQSDFAAGREKFVSDFISYQQGLEELVDMDCKAEPVKFYEKLVAVRKKRKMVADDTSKIRVLMKKQVSLVTALKEKI